MDLILDTCALLSLVGLADKRLTRGTQKNLGVADKVYVSSCTMFEIAIKHKKKNLDLGNFNTSEELWHIAMKEYQLTELAVSHEIFYESVMLPDHHSDPFDRIILAHSIKLGIPIVTFDAMFKMYEASVIS